MEPTMAKTTTKSDEISILEIHTGEAQFCILGTSPLLFNRMAEKAKRELLMPKGRKTTADRASSLKHNPLEEYRNSVYRRSDHVPGLTRLLFPTPAFKAAMATAALDLPGAKKSEIGRLAWALGDKVEIFGIPKLRMDVVRSADMNRTPDVRTRACVGEWACRVTIRFVRPKLRDQAVANLMAAAGVTCGIGDFRQEKGKGNNGQFILVEPDHRDFVRLTTECGTDAQDAALAHPEMWDEETAEMMEWFSAEIVKLHGKRDAA
jgi:hypothetical protein